MPWFSFEKITRTNTLAWSVRSQHTRDDGPVTWFRACQRSVSKKEESFSWRDESVFGKEEGVSREEEV